MLYNGNKHDIYAHWSEVFSEFPDPELFEPGIKIIKVGATTEITKGFLLDIRQLWMKQQMGKEQPGKK